MTAEPEDGTRHDGRGAALAPDSFGRRLYSASEALAVIGGLFLLGVTGFTVASVVGRTALDAPVLGDQEIVEIGCAIAIFAFMPYCQMRAANVIVDFFTARMPARGRDMLDALMNAVFSACVLVLTWRLAIGGLYAFRAGDFSMFLKIPQWWGYAVAMIACLLWTIVCFYSAYRSWRGGARPGDTSEM